MKKNRSESIASEWDDGPVNRISIPTVSYIKKMNEENSSSMKSKVEPENSRKTSLIQESLENSELNRENLKQKNKHKSKTSIEDKKAKKMKNKMAKEKSSRISDVLNKIEKGQTEIDKEIKKSIVNSSANRTSVNKDIEINSNTRISIADLLSANETKDVVENSNEFDIINEETSNKILNSEELIEILNKAESSKTINKVESNKILSKVESNKIPHDLSHTDLTTYEKDKDQSNIKLSSESTHPINNNIFKDKNEKLNTNVNILQSENEVYCTNNTSVIDKSNKNAQTDIELVYPILIQIIQEFFKKMQIPFLTTRQQKDFYDYLMMYLYYSNENENENSGEKNEETTRNRESKLKTNMELLATINSKPAKKVGAILTDVKEENVTKYIKNEGKEEDDGGMNFYDRPSIVTVQDKNMYKSTKNQENSHSNKPDLNTKKAAVISSSDYINDYLMKNAINAMSNKTIVNESKNSKIFNETKSLPYKWNLEENRLASIEDDNIIGSIEDYYKYPANKKKVNIVARKTEEKEICNSLYKIISARTELYSKYKIYLWTSYTLRLQIEQNNIRIVDCKQKNDENCVKALEQYGRTLLKRYTKIYKIGMGIYHELFNISDHLLLKVQSFSNLLAEFKSQEINSLRTIDTEVKTPIKSNINLGSTDDLLFITPCKMSFPQSPPVTPFRPASAICPSRQNVRRIGNSIRPSVVIGHSKRSLNTPVSIPSNIRDVPLITQNEVVAYSIPRSKSSCNKHKPNFPEHYFDDVKK